jgi:hypothetical protein
MAKPDDQPTMPLEPPVDAPTSRPSPGASAAPIPTAVVGEPVLLAAILVIVAIFASAIVLVAFRGVRGPAPPP